MRAGAGARDAASLTERISRAPEGARRALGAAMFAALGAGEYFARNSGLDLPIFYVGPVTYATWFFGLRSGILVGVGGALAALAVRTPIRRRRAVRISNTLLRTGLYTAAALLTSELDRLYDREHQMSRHDALTGMPNRRVFLEVAELELERARRHQAPFTVIFLDLDHFKQVNDTQGHAAGDRALRMVARILESNLRAIDAAARLGGDEFVLLLPATGAEAAAAAGGKVLEKLRAAGMPASMGAVTFLQPPASAEEALRRADEQMYLAKRKGGSGISAAVSAA